MTNEEAKKREDMLLDMYKINAYIPNDAQGNPLTPFGNFCAGYEAAIAYMQEQNKSAEQSEPVMAIRLAINEILESGEKLPPNTRELVYFIKNVSGEILFQDPIAQVTKHGIFGIDRSTVFEVGTKLYTAPQRQQPLKRLSDEFKNNLYEKYWIKESMTFDELIEVVMDAMQELNK